MAAVWTCACWMAFGSPALAYYAGHSVGRRDERGDVRDVEERVGGGAPIQDNQSFVRPAFHAV